MHPNNWREPQGPPDTHRKFGRKEASLRYARPGQEGVCVEQQTAQTATHPSGALATKAPKRAWLPCSSPESPSLPLCSFLIDGSILGSLDTPGTLRNIQITNHQSKTVSSIAHRATRNHQSSDPTEGDLIGPESVRPTRSEFSVGIEMGPMEQDQRECGDVSWLS